jgi:hypothetical protein
MGVSVLGVLVLVLFVGILAAIVFLIVYGGRGGKSQ